MFLSFPPRLIGFQFHKVRLKAQFGDTAIAAPIVFQFHKVRLKGVVFNDQ